MSAALAWQNPLLDGRGIRAKRQLTEVRSARRRRLHAEAPHLRAPDHRHARAEPRKQAEAIRGQMIGIDVSNPVDATSGPYSTIGLDPSAVIPVETFHHSLSL